MVWSIWLRPWSAGRSGPLTPNGMVPSADDFQIPISRFWCREANFSNKSWPSPISTEGGDAMLMHFYTKHVLKIHLKKGVRILTASASMFLLRDSCSYWRQSNKRSCFLLFISTILILLLSIYLYLLLLLLFLLLCVFFCAFLLLCFLMPQMPHPAKVHRACEWRT